jgi:hypothetical protein
MGRATHVFHQLCQNVLRAFGLGRRRCERHAAVGDRSGSGLACGLRSVADHQKRRTGRRQATGVAGTQNSLRTEQARARHGEARPILAQECSLDGDCLAWARQLLFNRKADRERRSVRSICTDRRPSHVAIRHPVARDERRDRSIRDGSGQRPRSVHSGASCRCLALCSRSAGNGWKWRCEGQG